MVSCKPLGCLLLSGFLLTTYFTASYAQLETNTQPEVTISQGTLLGTTMTTRHGRNIYAFLGIPYAQPPIGNLRFASPVPADGWTGTRDASAEPSKCPQIGSGGQVVGDEDCLYVKVYTPQFPQNATSSPLLPVMVYIHGGAFAAESPDENGPGYLLDADIVLVVMNYRLGALGFLSTGDEVASGNWGLKDQVLALEWVRDNVHDFGGDPGKVTIFGESAGAASVHLLSLSNATIGLFHRYITQSGTALAPWCYKPRAAYSSRAFELGESLGCNNDTSDSLVSCLRTFGFAEIAIKQLDYVVWGSLGQGVWGPTDEPDIKGAVLTDSPSNLLAAGAIRDLPWMTGVVRDEGLLHTAALYAHEEMLYDFMDNIDTLLPIMMSWTYQSDSGAAWTNAVKSYYFNNDLTSDTSMLLKNFTTLINDAKFFYPAYESLRQQLAHQPVSPSYLYTLNYRGTYSYTYMDVDSAVSYGVRHADDLIYLFPKESVFSVYDATMSETDYEMVDTMVQLWTSFAINGTPTASALSGGMTWDPYSSDENYLRIGNESDVGLEVQYSFFKERMEFWANIDAAAESQGDSGAATSSPNLVFLLLVAGSLKFILTTAAVDRLGRGDS